MDEQRETPELAYDVVGPVGTGVPVVLLHAFPFERSLWRPVAHRLAAATVGVISVDLPGLGDSPLPDGPPDLAVSAAAVVAVLDRLQVSRAIVVGVSMGGYVALALVRGHRSRVAGLALVDTRADADAPDARDNRERMAQAVLGPAGTRALAPMVESLLGRTALDTRPDLVEDVRSRLAAARPEGVAWSQRAMAVRPETTGELAGIEVPAAVLVGDQDVLSGPAVAAAMAAALPDAVLTVFPGVGHLSPLEVPDQVADALLNLVVRR